jgi:hypothetical protein
MDCYSVDWQNISHAFLISRYAPLYDLSHSIWCNYPNLSRIRSSDNKIGTEMAHGLDGWGLISIRDKEFLSCPGWPMYPPSLLTIVTRPPSLLENQPRCETDHSQPSSSKVKNGRAMFVLYIIACKCDKIICNNFLIHSNWTHTICVWLFLCYTYLHANFIYSFIIQDWLYIYVHGFVESTINNNNNNNTATPHTSPWC